MGPHGAGCWSPPFPDTGEREGFVWLQRGPALLSSNESTLGSPAFLLALLPAPALSIRPGADPSSMPGPRVVQCMERAGCLHLPSAMRDADRELFDRAHSRESTALDTLIERHLPALRAYVRLNVPPSVRVHESCSDLVQSVCREILGAREGFEYRGPEAFRAWLFRWALHKVKDRAKFFRAEKRAAHREVKLADESQLGALYASVGTPSAAAIANENAALLEQAFDRLADEDRQVLALCKIAGLPREEVAGLLGKSPGAVRTQLSRALVRLAAALEQLGMGQETL